MIVAAAVKINNAVISMAAPARHHDILRAIVSLYEPGSRPSWTYAEEEQGFVTNKGEFLGRREAFNHARNCGQGTPRRRTAPGNYEGDELFSEDLW